MCVSGGDCDHLTEDNATQYTHTQVAPLGSATSAESLVQQERHALGPDLQKIL